MRRDKRAAEPPAFAAFWSIYPRKVARAAALKVWIKIDPTSDLIQLIQSALIAQRAELLSREVGKVPHAATWLNGERWNDALEAAGKAAPPDPRCAWHRDPRNDSRQSNYPKPGCPRCKHFTAARAGRTGDATDIGELMARKSAEIETAAERERLAAAERFARDKSGDTKPSATGGPT